MKLHELASLILAIEHHSMRRVRFAKAIYFTHKALVNQKLMLISDIAYIRLPLGPVPDGFLSLALDYPELISEKTDIIGHLSYESEFFPAHPEPETFIASFDQKITSVVRQILTLLDGFSTPELVKHSQDPSWLMHFNGEHYELTPLDLKNTFPILPKAQRLFQKTAKITIRLPSKFRLQFKIPPNSPPTEIGTLQANLLRGMLKDIVKESTDLEYPDETSTKDHSSNTKDSKSGNNPDTPNQGSKNREHQLHE